MEHREVSESFGATESKIDINTIDEKGRQTSPSYLNDSIGLNRQKLRDSKEQELTPS